MERLQLAQQKADRMVDLARALDQVHQTNQIVLYTNTLASQIPRSFAGHAFKQFQQSLYLFELIRLSAMWDGPGGDRDSIPTIRRLLQDRDVFAEAVARVERHYAEPGQVHIINEVDAGPEATAGILEVIRNEAAAAAVDRAERAAAALEEGIRRSLEIEQSGLLARLVELRGQGIAHNLHLPSTGDPASPERWRYGGETDLLAETIDIIDLFHRALNDSSFDWRDMRRQHRRNAHHLWHSCRFTIDPL